MKKNNKVYFNNQNGITMIALVVTIIVLLILASVSITYLKGNNNIISQSNSADLEVTLMQVKEILNAEYYRELTEQNMGGAKVSLENIIKNFNNGNKIYNVMRVENEYYLNYKGLYYKITLDNGINIDTKGESF